MNSFVGIDSRVLISTWNTFKDNLSFLCKKGTLNPAWPLNIFLFPSPEIIIASSGPALVYEQSKKIINKTNTAIPRRIHNHNIILSSLFFTRESAEYYQNSLCNIIIHIYTFIYKYFRKK